MSAQPRIAIVGGGPAGLALGVLLHKHRIPFTIFELRSKPSEEELAKPSGMLDLHEQSGITVIKECGLYDDFLPLTGECSQEFILAERNGTVLFTMEDQGSRPEISRNNLTKLLISRVPTGSIKWNHKLLSAKAMVVSNKHETELDFGSHGKQTFDLVVGADGAWSEVRKLLSNTKPNFTDMHIITITIKNITKKYPHLAKLVGSGSFSALGNKHAVVSQRGPIDSSRIYLWLTVPDEHFATSSGLAGHPASSAKAKILEDDSLLGSFGSSIKELVAVACDEESADHPGSSIDIRALYTLPHGGTWEHKSGITLIGDAAHLMLPNGEGVNAAMFDALMLSQAIAKAHKKGDTEIESFHRGFDPLLKEFEASVIERAKEEGRDTDELIGTMFGSLDAAYDMAKFFKSAMEQHGRSTVNYDTEQR